MWSRWLLVPGSPTSATTPRQAETMLRWLGAGPGEAMPEMLTLRERGSVRVVLFFPLCRFKVLEGPASEWIAQDSYSPRWLNWVRLLEYSSNTVIFFANTHGPLGQCTGQRPNKKKQSKQSGRTGRANMQC